MASSVLHGVADALACVARFRYDAPAVAAAQANARLISPFPGRIKDWHGANGGEACGVTGVPTVLGSAGKASGAGALFSATGLESRMAH